MRSQRRKDYTVQLDHHACFTCEVNGFQGRIQDSARGGAYGQAPYEKVGGGGGGGAVHFRSDIRKVGGGGGGQFASGPIRKVGGGGGAIRFGSDTKSGGGGGGRFAWGPIRKVGGGGGGGNSLRVRYEKWGGGGGGGGLGCSNTSHARANELNCRF